MNPKIQNMNNNLKQFQEESQFDDNLLRSIETLLDEQQANNREANKINCLDGIDGEIPEFRQVNDDEFSIGEEIYHKWSNTDSTGNGAKISRSINGHKFGVNQLKPPHIIKTLRNNPSLNLTIPSPQPVGQQFFQHQTMLAEKANHLMHQYLQLNYEFLSAQAAVLGIPLDQYIRNLLIATTSQAQMPVQVPQTLQGIPLPNANPNQQNAQQPQQRKFNRLPFAKKN